MEQKSISCDEKTIGPERKVAIKNFDSWSISLYKKQRRLIIRALDYHAGPLIITRDELCDIAKLMGLHVNKRRRINKLRISNMVTRNPHEVIQPTDGDAKKRRASSAY